MRKESRQDKIIHVSDRIGHYIEKSSGFISVIFFSSMIIVVLIGVIARYVMRSPFEWTEEIARFLMLGIIFLSINMALRQKEHIAIRTLAEALPKYLANYLDYIIDILIGFFLIILIRQGYIMATSTLMTAGTIKISMFWIYILVPLGAFLTLIQLVVNNITKILSGSSDFSV